MFMESTTSAQEPEAPGHAHALADLPFPDSGRRRARFRRLRLLELDHVVEGLGDLAVDAGQVERHAHGEVAALERAQALESSPRSSTM
jgi:hypothetical protein